MSGNQSHYSDRQCNIKLLDHYRLSLQQEGEEITINSLHPGAIHANLLRHQGFVNGKSFLSLITFIFPRFCTLTTYFGFETFTGVN